MAYDEAEDLRAQMSQAMAERERQLVNSIGSGKLGMGSRNTVNPYQGQGDALGHVRGVCLARLDQLQASISEYEKQHEILAQIRMQAERECAQLQSVLHAIDKATAPAPPMPTAYGAPGTPTNFPGAYEG